jgi:hypothetical protein
VADRPVDRQAELALDVLIPRVPRKPVNGTAANAARDPVGKLIEKRVHPAVDPAAPSTQRGRCEIPDNQATIKGHDSLYHRGFAGSIGVAAADGCP